jgi:uncharacterized protein (TIGR03437 family)
VGNFGSQWRLTSQPTGGAVNVTSSVAPPTTGTGQLLINEFMVDNRSSLQDPDEPGAFEDWFEIYNPGNAEVDMSGMYLTDSFSTPTKYRIPSGVRIPARGYLVFWADNDTGQGPRHANFALDADGERLGLYASDGSTLIDSITFTTQQENISFGRASDGAGEWTIFQPATPGATNASGFASWIANGASYRLGPLAAASVASAFGQNLASGTTIASSTPLPQSLGGITITLTDSAGSSFSAPLYFVSAQQVNFQIPAAAARGRARVALRKQDGSSLTGDILIGPVGPGLFSANASGEGVGLIAGLRVDGSGTQSGIPVYAYDAQQGRAVPMPVNLGDATDKIYLTIYTTGVRGAISTSDVAVQVGDTDVPVTYAGPQSEFPGIDQINIGPLPRSLAGQGQVDVELTINNVRANRVTVTIQ